MKKILVPIDGSKESLAALRAAVGAGPTAVARIELVNVQPYFHRHVSRWIARSTRDVWRAERSTRALAPARRIVAHAGIPYDVHVITGPMRRSIAQAARVLGVDEVAYLPRRGLVERLALPAGLGLVALMLIAEE